MNLLVCARIFIFNEEDIISLKKVCQEIALSYPFFRLHVEKQVAYGGRLFLQTSRAAI